jgi:hypothetical protein
MTEQQGGRRGHIQGPKAGEGGDLDRRQPNALPGGRLPQALEKVHEERVRRQGHEGWWSRLALQLLEADLEQVGRLLRQVHQRLTRLRRLTVASRGTRKAHAPSHHRPLHGQV